MKDKLNNKSIIAFDFLVFNNVQSLVNYVLIMTKKVINYIKISEFGFHLRYWILNSCIFFSALCSLMKASLAQQKKKTTLANTITQTRSQKLLLDY